MKSKIKIWWLRQLSNIQRRARKKSQLAAIEKARKITSETDKKVLIYFIKGEYVVMTKQELKARWKDKQFVGYTIQELEKFAEGKTENYGKANNDTTTRGTWPGKKVIRG